MQNKIFSGLLGVLLLVAGACTLPPRPAQQPASYYWAQVQPLITERRYGQATTILEQAAQAYPEDTAFLDRMGQIYLAQRRWLLAEDAFNRALARHGQDARATAGLAEALFNQGRIGDARRFWLRAASIDPQLPRVFTGLGRTHLQFFDFDAAKAAFFEQQRHTTDPDANWYLAALTAPVDLSAAVDFLLAIPSTPAGTGQSRTSASPILRRDYLLAALAPYTTETPPVEVAKTTGIALAQIEQWPLAVHALNLALEQSAGSSAAPEAELLAFLAHARAQAGKPALDLFEQAQAADPDSALPLYFEALYLRQQGALNAAADLFEQAVTLDPENAAVYIELARVREQQGDLATAEALYAAATEIAKDELPFQLLLLKFYANRSYRVEEAGIPLAERLIEADPNNADVHDLLGWMRFLSGAPDGGEQALRQALDLDSHSVSARYHLARYFESTGQAALAEAEYQRVVDWDISGVLRSQALTGLRRLATE